MDLNFTTEEENFRTEVRAFLADKLPARLSDQVASGMHLSKADLEQWHAILNARGWLANHWPEQYGGPGWSAVEKFIFEHECCLAHAPRIVPFGVNMLGPVLIKFGNETQKRHWLPRILDGSDWWCQGYSETGAGSDLAAVSTTASPGPMSSRSPSSCIARAPLRTRMSSWLSMVRSRWRCPAAPPPTLGAGQQCLVQCRATARCAGG